MPRKLTDRNNLFNFLQEGIDALLEPSEVFHENSKLYPSSLKWFSNVDKINRSNSLNVISRPYRHFYGYPHISLPRDFQQTPSTFEEIVMKRHSTNYMSGTPVSLQSLSKILSIGNGISRSSNKSYFAGRTTPSAGALYPIELYCFAIRVLNLQPGVYFYDVFYHCLTQLASGDFSDQISKVMPGSEPIIRKSCFCIALVSVMPRTKFKYGERGYRFALIESGHIAQNILLAAEAENLAAIPIGGFFDDEFNVLLNLDGVEEAVVYSILVGNHMHNLQ